MGGATIAGGDVDEDNDDEKDPNKKKESSPKDKPPKEKPNADEEEDVQIIASMEKETQKPTQDTPTSTSRADASSHSLIPFSIASQEEIKSIFSTQVVEPID